MTFELRKTGDKTADDLHVLAELYANIEDGDGHLVNCSFDYQDDAHQVVTNNGHHYGISGIRSMEVTVTVKLNL